ncbi:MAG: hypothetical protein JW829_05995 [Pirellulales bacterium]|nr:hypothetical protein [Pirellulales bacterium]
MSTKEEKSSWDELAKLLGTQTSHETIQPLQPESVSNLPSEPRISARPVRPRRSDWNVLASELGLSLPAVPPPLSGESPSKSPTSVPEAPAMVPEEQHPMPPLSRSPTESQREMEEADGIGVTSVLQNDALSLEPSATRSAEIMDRSSPQGLFENSSERPSVSILSNAPGAPWPDLPMEPPSAEESEPGSMDSDAVDISRLPDTGDIAIPAMPSKESRRRRRGGRRRSAAAKRTQTTSETASQIQAVTGPSNITAGRKKHVPGHSEDVSDAPSTRKKRRRRGGGDRRSKPSEMPADTPTSQPEETAAEIQTQFLWDFSSDPFDTAPPPAAQDATKTAKIRRRKHHRSVSEMEPTQPVGEATSQPDQRVPELVLDKALEQTGSDQETGSAPSHIAEPADHQNKLSGKRSIHKNIPTWEETMSILIDNNLATRTPRNRSQRSGSKGGRHGRKR